MAFQTRHNWLSTSEALCEFMKVSSVGLQKESKVSVRESESLERWVLRALYSCEFLTSLSESLEPIVRSLGWTAVVEYSWLCVAGRDWSFL
jgi:hypothetical protein